MFDAEKNNGFVFAACSPPRRYGLTTDDLGNWWKNVKKGKHNTGGHVGSSGGGRPKKLDFKSVQAIKLKLRAQEKMVRPLSTPTMIRFVAREVAETSKRQRVHPENEVWLDASDDPVSKHTLRDLAQVPEIFVRGTQNLTDARLASLEDQRAIYIQTMVYAALCKWSPAWAKWNIGKQFVIFVQKSHTASQMPPAL